MRMSFNDGWFFTENFADSLKTISPLDAQALMESVRLPHSVCRQQLNYCSEEDCQMVSGYVHFLDVPREWEGRRVILHFGAAAHEASVYCNGFLAAVHHCGYTAFSAELSPFLNWGKMNRITVRLDSRERLNEPPFGYAIDYMTYGGLYRGVELEVKDDDQCGLTDLFVHGGLDGLAHVQLSGYGLEGCRMQVYITEVETGEDWLDEGEETVAARSDVIPFRSSFEMSVPEAKLWDIRCPNLYRITVHLIRDGRRADMLMARFGFRTVSFREEGFFLNGRHLKLRGLNRHQSWPYMGYAVPDRAQALDADILKAELGCNAVRTSHYPQSQAFLDRCDEIGLLVFTEIPGWQHIGDERWKEQAIDNTADMVVQNRNHPSIFLWGVRINESGDDDALYRRTNETAHMLDPTRPTGGVRCIKKSHLLEDVYTYNDFSCDGKTPGCEPKGAVTADMGKGYLISEYAGHMLPTKAWDDEEHRMRHALLHAKVLNEVRAQKNIAGSFGWCMFDYHTHSDFGSGDRVCYHGVMDMFRNPKLAASVYAAEGAEHPVLAVSSSMAIGDHPAGELGEVYVFTNGDEVELYRNGELVKRFYPQPVPPGSSAARSLGRGGARGQRRESRAALPGPSAESRGTGIFPQMKHPPILIDDMVGSLMESHEGFSHGMSEDVKRIFRSVRGGQVVLSPGAMVSAAKLMTLRRMDYGRLRELYGKYIGGWGEKGTRWEFVAKKNGRATARVVKDSVTGLHLRVQCDTRLLEEKGAWDMATIRIQAVDQNGNVLVYCQRCLTFTVRGPIELVGPACVPLSGGMAGTYVRTVGQSGKASLLIGAEGMDSVSIPFAVSVRD